MYAAREVDRVVLVYNHFVSALTQRLEEIELLPVPEDGAGRRGGGQDRGLLHLRAGRADVLTS